MKDAILELLAQGRESPENISRICGCTPSYISQLLTDADFVQQLRERKSTLGNVAVDNLVSAKNNTHDSKLDLLEDRAMNKLAQLLPMVTKPMEAMKLFQVLNSAKRKNDLQVVNGNITNTTNNVVVLNLPATVKNKLLVNKNNEVVQVGDRPLVTMDSQLLLKVNREELTAKAEAAKLTVRTAASNLPMDELLKEIS